MKMEEMDGLIIVPEGGEVMLKEEKELRKYVLGPEHPMNASVIRSMIAALIRAVEERCAKVAEGVHVDEYGNGQICDAAAAIRGRK